MRAPALLLRGYWGAATEHRNKCGLESACVRPIGRKPRDQSVFHQRHISHVIRKSEKMPAENPPEHPGPLGHHTTRRLSDNS